MFKQIWQAFRGQLNSQPTLPVEGELLALLEQVAAEEGKTVDAVVGELLWNGVAERFTAVENFQPWEKLTPREKETAALACLGYTNHEIAVLMVISTNTVKTHMRQVLRKFKARDKNELREVLTGWDFADWLEEQDLGRIPVSKATKAASSDGTNP